MLLFIGQNEGKYDTVICLKSVSITDSVASIDISSWCGPGKLPGLNDITLSFEGYHIQDPLTDTISGTNLRVFMRDKAFIAWKLSPENPVVGDEIQKGIGFISQLDSTYSFDNVGSFNFTITSRTDITTEIVPLLELGMEYQGGTIAWLDETGQHGLIIANIDYTSDSLQNSVWSNIYGSFFGITSTAYGDGSTNTNAIVTADGSTSQAAGYCQDLISGGYTDWFLPTVDELSNIWAAGQIPAAFSLLIWTSSEFDSNNALALYVYDGSISDNLKYGPFGILPCRYF